MKNLLEKTRSFTFKNAMMISIFMLGVFVALNVPLFFTKESLSNLASQAACFGIVSVGMMLEMVTGVSDISVGSGVYLSGALGVRTFLLTGNVALSILTSIVSGIIGSAIPGICVSYFGMPDMISGMAVMFLLRGIGDMVIGADSVVNLADATFQWFGQGKVLGISFPVLVMIVMFLFGIFLLHFTRFGRYVYAVGDNRDALRASGVNDRLIQLLCFLFTGFTVGIAGFLYVARIGGTTFKIGDGLEFNCIAACAVGGVNIAGGAGTMPGAALGVVVIAAIMQLLRLFNVSAHLYKLVWGLVVIVSVGFGILRQHQFNYEKIRRSAAQREQDHQTELMKHS